MVKITENSIMVCAILICSGSGSVAMAGSPYNLTLPPPGVQGVPHVAQPVLRQRPVISPSLGHARQATIAYTAITKSRVRKQGTVSAGGASWNCTGNRCTTSTTWTRPTVRACKALAGVVGAIQSFSKRGAGLGARKLRRCNEGIVTVSVNRKTTTTFNRGLAARAPVIAPRLPVGGVTGLPRTPPVVHAPPVRVGSIPRTGGSHALNPPAPRQGGFASKQTSNGSGSAAKGSHRGGFAPSRPSTTASGATSGGSSSAPSHPRGGFAPQGLAGQVHARNALSQQQIAQIGIRKGYWQDYQRAMEEQRRRDAAEARARIERLSREARRNADCDDTDPEIHPGLLEVCDHKDNNCDGRVDEGTTILSYLDADGDTHGDPATAEPVCSSDIRAAQSRGEWLVTIGNDCNDADPDIWHDCPAP